MCCRNQTCSTSSPSYGTSFQKNLLSSQGARPSDLLPSCPKQLRRPLPCLLSHRNCLRGRRAPYSPLSRPMDNQPCHPCHPRNRVNSLSEQTALLRCPLRRRESRGHQVRACMAPPCSQHLRHSQFRASARHDTIAPRLCLPRHINHNNQHRRVRHSRFIHMGRPLFNMLKSISSILLSTLRTRRALHRLSCLLPTLVACPAFPHSLMLNTRARRHRYRSKSGSSILHRQCLPSPSESHRRNLISWTSR